MKVFDYIFYKIFLLYQKMGEDNADIPAKVVLSICQTANILTFIPFFINIRLNNWIFLIIFLPLYGFNDFYYFTLKRVVKLKEKWKNETKARKYIGGGVVILYIIASFTLCYFALGYYEGYSNWKWDI